MAELNCLQLGGDGDTPIVACVVRWLRRAGTTRRSRRTCVADGDVASFPSKAAANTPHASIGASPSTAGTDRRGAAGSLTRTAANRSVGPGPLVLPSPYRTRQTSHMSLSAAPELLDLPAVRRLLQVQVDMQVADLMAMLRLPKPYVGLTESMNLTAAAQVFGLISGMSVLLYRADYEYLKNPTDAGRRFKGMVREYMPLTHPEDLGPGHAAEVMWKFARNPLALVRGGQRPSVVPGPSWI
jgi:hypothetical protein